MNKARVYSIFTIFLILLTIVTFAQTPAVPTPESLNLQTPEQQEVQQQYKQQEAQRQVSNTIFSAVIAFLIILAIGIGILIYSRTNVALRGIIKYNFWILLVSIIVISLLGFTNRGAIYFLEGIPLICVISLILNIILATKNKNLSLKYKISLIVVMPIIVTALYVGITIYLVLFIVHFVFGYDKFMYLGK